MENLNRVYRAIYKRRIFDRCPINLWTNIVVGIELCSFGISLASWRLFFFLGINFTRKIDKDGGDFSFEFDPNATIMNKHR